jgi:hypothetical protein
MLSIGKSVANTLVGRKFSKLTVISRAESIKLGEPLWNCRCDCGSECQITEYNLRSGNISSCGCSKEGPVGAATKENFAPLILEPKDKIEFKGKLKTLAAHAKDNKISSKVVINRLTEGWDLERALTTPASPNKKKKEK